jgi:hypothetical protein
MVVPEGGHGTANIGDDVAELVSTVSAHGNKDRHVGELRCRGRHAIATPRAGAPAVRPGLRVTVVTSLA